MALELIGLLCKYKAMLIILILNVDLMLMFDSYNVDNILVLILLLILILSEYNIIQKKLKRLPLIKT